MHVPAFKKFISKDNICTYLKKIIQNIKRTVTKSLPRPGCPSPPQREDTLNIFLLSILPGSFLCKHEHLSVSKPPFLCECTGQALSPVGLSSAHAHPRQLCEQSCEPSGSHQGQSNQRPWAFFLFLFFSSFLGT